MLNHNHQSQTGSQPVLTFIVADVIGHCPSLQQFVYSLQNSNIGFNVVDITKSTLDDVAQALKKSDGVLVEAAVIGARKRPELFPHYLQFKRPVSQKRLDSVVSAVFSIEVPLILVATDFDLHGPLAGGLSPEELNRFDSLAWNYVELPPGAASLRSENDFESWMSEGLNPKSNWESIGTKIPSQIEFPHAVLLSDLGNSVSHAYWDACVPGAQYSTRKQAAESVKSSSLKLAPYQLANQIALKSTAPFRHFGNLGDQLRFKAQAANQRTLVRNSKSCWVDGSGYDYFVRKFIEVPALCTPMVTPPMPMLTRMGFEPNETRLETSPEQFGTMVSEVLKQAPNTAKAMARRAQEVVRQHHLWSHRLMSLQRVASEIVEGSRSTWMYQHGALVDIQSSRRSS